MTSPIRLPLQAPGDPRDPPPAPIPGEQSALSRDPRSPQWLLGATQLCQSAQVTASWGVRRNPKKASRTKLPMTADNPIRQATERLITLVNQSSGAGSRTLALFRAVRQLERTAAVSDPAKLGELVRAATKELRYCLSRIQDSSREHAIDLAKLEEIAATLELLFPLEGPATRASAETHGPEAASAVVAASTPDSLDESPAVDSSSASTTAPDPGAFWPATRVLPEGGYSAPEGAARETAGAHTSEAGPGAVRDSAADSSAKVATMDGARDVVWPATRNSPRDGEPEGTSARERGRAAGVTGDVEAPPAAPGQFWAKTSKLPEDYVPLIEQSRSRPGRRILRAPRPCRLEHPAPLVMPELVAKAPALPPPAKIVITRPEPDAAKVHAFLAELESGCRRVARVFDSRRATIEHLMIAERHLQEFFSAARWLPPSWLAPLEQIITGTDDARQRLGAAVALVLAGASGADEQLLTMLADHIDSSLVAVLLHRLADDLRLSPTSLASTPNSKLRALMVPVLATKRHLSATDLEELLSDRSDDVAVQAAQALAWVWYADRRPEILGRPRSLLPPARASAILFAAAALGRRQALNEMRDELAGSSEPESLVLDAFVIAGGEADGARLTDLALGRDGAVEDVLLAAAALGADATAQVLPKFRDRVSEDVFAEANRLLPDQEPPSCERKGLRRMFGKPWAVAAVIERVMAADEPLMLRRRHALEACVRTGTQPPAYFPAHGTAETWRELLASWQASFSGASRLQPGGWYYMGRSCGLDEH